LLRWALGFAHYLGVQQAVGRISEAPSATASRNVKLDPAESGQSALGCLAAANSRASFNPDYPRGQVTAPLGCH